MDSLRVKHIEHFHEARLIRIATWGIRHLAGPISDFGPGGRRGSVALELRVSGGFEERTVAGLANRFMSGAGGFCLTWFVGERASF